MLVNTLRDHIFEDYTPVLVQGVKFICDRHFKNKKFNGEDLDHRLRPAGTVSVNGLKYYFCSTTESTLAEQMFLVWCIVTMRLLS